MSKHKKGIKEKKEVKDQIVKERKKQSLTMHRQSMSKQNDYIKNIINGRYYLARSNMLVDQINNEDILENIDGCKKTGEYIRAEIALMKYQGITSMRNAHFAKLDLIKDFKFTAGNILAIEDDYYNGKIVREEYDKSHKKRGKAEFIKDTQ